MKIFTSKQIKQIDAYTIENEPIRSVDLMERAAKALTKWIRNNFEKETPFLLIAGPGNNGGDVWAMARMLYQYGYENIRFFLLNISDSLSPDSEINRKRLFNETDVRPKVIKDDDDFPYISKDEWVIDGIFGSGLNRPVEGLAKSIIQYVNSSSKAGVISVDIPSGLFGESNIDNTPENIIRSTYTLSLQFPKLSYHLAENEKFVGKHYVLPIGLHPEIISQLETSYYYIAKDDVSKLLKKRSRFSHKGTFGNCLIVAGSYGMMGAAVLAARSAIRSGAGLITAHIPRLGYNIMQISAPEALISFDESDLIFTEVNNLEKYASIAVGPGLNVKSNTEKALLSLIENAQVPLVLDADALNILSKNKDWLKALPEDTILTPHPGEFDRLTIPHSNSWDRLQTQINLSKELGVTIILKGANTSISFANGDVWFNTTGNPGMATGGSGDVLTGMICALLSQGYNTKEATLMAVYVHGLAGDIVEAKIGQMSLSASDIIDNIGAALKTLEE